MATKKSAAQKKAELTEMVEPEVTENPVDEAPVEAAPVDEAPVEEIVIDMRPDKSCCGSLTVCPKCAPNSTLVADFAEAIGVPVDTAHGAFLRARAVAEMQMLANPKPKPVRLNFWLKQGAEIIIEAGEICGIVVRDDYPETLVLRGGLTYDLATSVGLHAAKATKNRVRYQDWLDG